MLQVIKSVILSLTLSVFILQPLAQAKGLEKAAAKNQEVISNYLEKAQSRYDSFSDKKKLRVLKRSKKRLNKIINSPNSVVNNDLSADEKHLLGDTSSLNSLKLTNGRVDMKVALEESVKTIDEAITELEYKLAGKVLKTERTIAAVPIIIGIVVGVIAGIVVFYILLGSILAGAYSNW